MPCFVGLSSLNTTLFAENPAVRVVIVTAAPRLNADKRRILVVGSPDTESLKACPAYLYALAAVFGNKGAGF